MIDYAYEQRNQYNSTRVRTLLCTVVFIDLTAFFFLSFMNICFDAIVSHPPIWILFILFMVMGLDLFASLYLKRRITIKFCLHLIIMIFLIMSWAIDNSSILFLSALIFLRFPEIIRFNNIMQEKLRSYHKLFKLYTLGKIFYLIAVVGHVLGCIFYAIDNTLIKAQYYGNIHQNPSMYYQGQLLCYTPIYALSQINRYLYCMYYILSLLATVAYGDIIPKNPFENAYVCILLVLSTVSISFIIEQLLIVLSDNWETIYTILKKLKYFDSMLSKAVGVSSISRLKLTSFVFHSMMHEAHNNPNIGRLTPSLQFRLMGESIGMKKKKDSNSDFEHEASKMMNMRFIEQYSLPGFLTEFLLTKLQLKYYPNKYLIIDNENHYQDVSIYISLRGELKLGYGPLFLLRKTLKYKNKLFCWRQFLLDNKYVHRHFRIQTKVLSELYTTNASSLRNQIKNERAKRISDDNFGIMLEKYHVARDRELFLMHEEMTQIRQQTSSINLILLQENENEEEEDGAEISSHIMRCWGCGKRTHFPINCPNLHYKVNIHQALAHSQRKIERNRYIERRSSRSLKIRPIYREADQSQKDKIFLRNLLAKKSQELKNLKDILVGRQAKIFERYENYEYYFHEFNFRIHNESL